MKILTRWIGVIVGCAALFGSGSVFAQDWPQWRGPNRDAKANGFDAPRTWPKGLTQKWKVAVGNGVATPALVGDRLFVFSREGTDEIIRCLDAASGNEIWKDHYAAAGATGAAGGFPGPRSSPTVADGKIVTLGVRGALSCLDATTGKELWRKKEFSNVPRFFTSCSPIVTGGLCIVQLGGEDRGGIVAYDLATGNEKWKWTGDGTAYASPVLLTVEGVEVIVAETAKKIVGIGIAEGKLLWETPFAVSRGGYNAATPIVDAQTIIYSGSGRGIKAVKIEKTGDRLMAKELWKNSEKETDILFSTPVLKNGLLFGLSSRNFLFCINAATGKTAWTKRVSGGNERGYGSIVDIGPALLSLTPASQLLVFEPTDKEYKELAKYKVSDEDTYAYPIASAKRVYIKDQDSVTEWALE